MPTMKLSEIRRLPVAEIDRLVRQKKEELMKLRFQATIGQLEKNHLVKATKVEIAQLLTVRKEGSHA